LSPTSAGCFSVTAYLQKALVEKRLKFFSALKRVSQVDGGGGSDHVAGLDSLDAVESLGTRGSASGVAVAPLNESGRFGQSGRAATRDQAIRLYSV